MEPNKEFFYCNSMQIAVSPFDINLKFIRQGTPENAVDGITQPIKLDEFSVLMSPTHAKAMLAGLYKSIMDYETKVGPIALEAATQKMFTDTFGPIIKK